MKYRGIVSVERIIGGIAIEIAIETNGNMCRRVTGVCDIRSSNGRVPNTEPN